eukprot:GFUD01004456.1.p1 GENE.GFUD01004456.1~~GFUD01004456.1.p1  ORF type:complete len:815 (-),score=258.12 GFUD01004456.1:609-3053(-)
MSDSSDLPTLLEDIRNLATRAVHFESVSSPGVAGYYYTQTARLIYQAIQMGADQPGLEDRARQYEAHGRTLAGKLPPPTEGGVSREPGTSELSRAFNLLNEALELDETGEQEEALEQYKQAVEVCLTARQVVDSKEVKEKLNIVAEQALERAESIRADMEQNREVAVEVTKNKPATVTSLVKPLGNLDWGSESGAGGGGGGKGGYSEEEKKVLTATSRVNGREYLPFITADLRERFAFPVPWSDPAGKLPLAPKQKQKLKDWCRPEEFIAHPKMIELVDCYSVKQTVVSDCSFVASIAIAAQYEKKFRKRLITSIIYPQNKAGDPVYNPAGKYMVKLHINGIARKVVVDDFLPIGPGNEPLCSYSSNKSELWISLLEKAYMKVMGGYDFPGSNSNIDLFALTGWIPERVAIRPNDPTFNAEAAFSLLLKRFSVGQCLATLATGELSDAKADRAGLVSTHAYAVLDVREVDGVKLLKLKNPWSHLRWRGNWSELDTTHWTDNFRKQLNYNPEDAANFDNGVFWIDYTSLQHYFDVLYMNWDPAMFRHNTTLHGAWQAGRGPAKDIMNMGDNPQFRLEVKEASGGGAVWLLLSRHITDIADFRDNKEYITLLVYKNDGNRVFYPYDPPPFIDGVRINSPHYLTKVILPPGDNVRRFTLVVSQFEKSSTIFFTVKAYSTLPFSLEKIKTTWRHKEEVTGKWSPGLAGGCANNKDTWPNNPRYQLVLDAPGQIHVQLKGPKQFQLGFDLLTVSATDTASPQYFKKKSSGVYRSGFVVYTMEAVAGTYELVPSTYTPGQEGPFFLMVASNSSFKLARTR